MPKATYNLAREAKWALPCPVVLLALLTGAVAPATCRIAPGTVSVTTTSVPQATTFSMPIGNNRSNLDQLTISTFRNFNYPKVRFENDAWYVSTAFNHNRWLNWGYNSEPSPATEDVNCNDQTFDSSLYSCRGDYHPGEDWNSTASSDADARTPIYAVADGVVLYKGKYYGNTVIIVHRLPVREPNGTVSVNYITSLYAHMDSPSTLNKGDRVTPNTKIGEIGKDATSFYHLHFELRGQSMLDAQSLSSGEICLAHEPGMWPAVNQAGSDHGRSFIASNYLSPSDFIKNHAPQSQISRTFLMTAGLISQTTCNVPQASATFPIGSDRIYLWFSVSGLSIGDRLSDRWTAGDGSLYKTANWNPVTTSSSCYWSWIEPEKDNIPASKAGDWTASLLRNGTRLFTASFRLVDASREPPSYSTEGAVEPWTYTPGLSPGGWTSLYGDYFSLQREEWKPVSGQPLQTTLSGVSVVINGIRSVLSYVSDKLVNFLVPDLPDGDATMVVERDGVPGTPVSIRIKKMHPAIYSLPITGTQLVRYYVTAAAAGTAELIGTRQADARVGRGARPGELVDLYVIGLGRTTGEFPTDRLFGGAFPVSEPVDVVLGQRRITPDFVGLTALGLYLVRIRIPQDISPQNAPIYLISNEIRSAENVYLTIDAPLPQVTLSRLDISPSSVAGGQSATGQVLLSSAAPTGGLDVQLSSSNAAVRPLATVRVPAGQQSASFTITTTIVSATVTATVTATLNGVQRSATLTVQGPANPFRNYEITIRTTFSLDGNQVSPRVVSGLTLPDLAEVSTYAPGFFDPNSRIVLLAYFNQPSYSANSVTYRAWQGNYGNLNPGSPGSGSIISGSLMLTAQSPNVGTVVTGNLRFATSSRSFNIDFTGTIASSQRVFD